MNKLKIFIKENQDNAVIAFISLIAFTVGCLSVGFMPAFLIIGIADLLLIIPGIIKKRKLPIKGRHASREKTKNKKVKQTNNKKEKPKKQKKKKNILKKLIITFLILCLLVMLAGIAFIGYIVVNAPKFDPEQLYHQEASILYDKNGNEFATLGTENREIISYDELPEVLIDAIIATEDSRFYQHNGFDLPRFIKASIQNVLTGGGGGASTLTMQVVKNHFTSTKQTITRKFTDIYMSMYEVEKNYTKEEILEFYVNAPYLGGRSYGVEQACKTYFGKSAKDINLAEAAMIAGLFQAPYSFDPTRDPESAEKRRQIVLKLMERHGYITKEERKIASEMTIDKLLVNKSEEGDNEYQVFVDTVIEDVEKTLGVSPYDKAMEIYTTMDPDKQDHINDIMNGKTWNWENDTVTAGIAVVDVNNGEIVAVGGGRNKTKERTLNTATQIKKQIGSTAKPLYDYGVGIEYENWSTYEPFTDENITYSDGKGIGNWDGGYKGFQTMREALSASRNISALKAFQKNKNSNINKFVTSLGLHPENSDGFVHEAHSIGGYTGENPLTMAGAYAAFGNGGYYIKPHSFSKIIYRDSEEEYDNKQEKKRVMSAETAYMMTSLLQSASKGGLGAYSNINGATYGAKTGTSNFSSADKRSLKLPNSAINDYWVDGVSPDYAISVWYGYEKPDHTHYNKFGTVYHEKLFQKVAKGIFKKGSRWSQPSGVKSITVELESYPAKLPSEFTPQNKKVTELFKVGNVPKEKSTRYAQLANVTNLTGSVSGNELSLSWTAIPTPSAINDEELTKWAKSLYKSAGYQSKFVSSKKSEMGSVEYKVYAKDSAGNLTLVGTTSESSIILIVDQTSAENYVVKSTFTNFAANASSGAEVSVSMSNASSKYEVKLNGANTIETTIGKYVEQGAIVIENGNQSDKQVTTTYYNSLTNVPVDLTTMNSTPGSYIAEYKYENASAKRNITIK